MIMEGNVFVENQREDKAGATFDTEAEITVKGNTLKYVSRGGLKLEKAMTHFGITLEGKVCIDVYKRQARRSWSATSSILSEETPWTSRGSERFILKNSSEWVILKMSRTFFR